MFFLLQANINTNTTVDEYCQKQTGIKSEEIEAYETEKKSDEYSEDFYCYVLCVFTETDVISEEGVFSIEKYKGLMDEKVDEECLKNVPIISECSDIAFLLSCD